MHSPLDVHERETFVARGLKIVLARIGGCWLFEHHRRELHREFDTNGVCLSLDSEQRETSASQMILSAFAKTWGEKEGGSVQKLFVHLY